MYKEFCNLITVFLTCFIDFADTFKCYGRNEIFHCGSPCQNLCATLGHNCEILHENCIEDCYCDVGFARNTNGDCIEIKECPKKVTCGKNEEYHSCTGPCSHQCAFASVFNCISKGESDRCYYGCNCKFGYVRNLEGHCVKLAECSANFELDGIDMY